MIVAMQFSTKNKTTDMKDALQKISELKKESLDLGESWYDRLTEAVSIAKNALASPTEIGQQGLSKEEILFKYHQHGDFIFPDIENLEGDKTVLYTHESMLLAMEEYASQSTPPQEGQKGDQEFLQMQFPGKEGSDIHKPTEQQEQEELAYILQIPNPQEGQDELWEDLVRLVEEHHFRKTEYPKVYEKLKSKYKLIKL